MTLTSEMSRITRVWGEAHTRRSRDIDNIRRATATLSDSIRRDLKIIPRQVALIRSSASGLIKRYKVARQVSAKEIKAKLRDYCAARVVSEKVFRAKMRDYYAARQLSTKVLRAKLAADRATLAPMVKNLMHGWEQDRIGAGQVYRDYVVSRQPKVNQSAAVSTRAPVVSPAIETGKTASVVAAPPMGGVPQK